LNEVALLVLDPIPSLRWSVPEPLHKQFSVHQIGDGTQGPKGPGMAVLVNGSHLKDALDVSDPLVYLLGGGWLASVPQFRPRSGRIQGPQQFGCPVRSAAGFARCLSDDCPSRKEEVGSGYSLTESCQALLRFASVFGFPEGVRHLSYPILGAGGWGTDKRRPIGGAMGCAVVVVTCPLMGRYGGTSRCSIIVVHMRSTKFRR
jgi:hypothetical protein